MFNYNHPVLSYIPYVKYFLLFTFDIVPFLVFTTNVLANISFNC